MSTRRGPLRGFRSVLARHVAPPRFVLFVLTAVLAALAWRFLQFKPWIEGLVVGFDMGAVVFALSLWPLAHDRGAEAMRRHARQNDANRGIVLVITAVTMLAIMAAIGAELPAARQGNVFAIGELVATLALVWLFTNLVFALHYAHMRYCEGKEGTGFDFPGTPEPDYWDFLYFSFTAGMSFAASDVNVTRGDVRRVLLAQSLLSFVFNIGVIAFSINVLAGASG